MAETSHLQDSCQPLDVKNYLQQNIDKADRLKQQLLKSASKSFKQLENQDSYVPWMPYDASDSSKMAGLTQHSKHKRATAGLSLFENQRGSPFAAASSKAADQKSSKSRLRSSDHLPQSLVESQSHGGGGVSFEQKYIGHSKLRGAAQPSRNDQIKNNGRDITSTNEQYGDLQQTRNQSNGSAVGKDRSNQTRSVQQLVPQELPLRRGSNEDSDRGSRGTQMMKPTVIFQQPRVNHVRSQKERKQGGKVPQALQKLRVVPIGAHQGVFEEFNRDLGLKTGSHQLINKKLASEQSAEQSQSYVKNTRKRFNLVMKQANLGTRLPNLYHNQLPQETLNKVDSAKSLIILGRSQKNSNSVTDLHRQYYPDNSKQFQVSSNISNAGDTAKQFGHSHGYLNNSSAEAQSHQLLPVVREGGKGGIIKQSESESRQYLLRKRTKPVGQVSPNQAYVDSEPGSHGLVVMSFGNVQGMQGSNPSHLRSQQEVKRNSLDMNEMKNVYNQKPTEVATPVAKSIDTQPLHRMRQSQTTDFSHVKNKERTYKDSKQESAFEQQRTKSPKINILLQLYAQDETPNQEQAASQGRDQMHPKDQSDMHASANAIYFTQDSQAAHLNAISRMKPTNPNSIDSNQEASPRPDRKALPELKHGLVQEYGGDGENSKVAQLLYVQGSSSAKAAMKEILTPIRYKSPSLMSFHKNSEHRASEIQGMNASLTPQNPAAHIIKSKQQSVHDQRVLALNQDFDGVIEGGNALQKKKTSSNLSKKESQNNVDSQQQRTPKAESNALENLQRRHTSNNIGVPGFAAQQNQSNRKRLRAKQMLANNGNSVASSLYGEAPPKEQQPNSQVASRGSSTKNLTQGAQSNDVSAGHEKPDTEPAKQHPYISLKVNDKQIAHQADSSTVQDAAQSSQIGQETEKLDLTNRSYQKAKSIKFTQDGKVQLTAKDWSEGKHSGSETVTVVLNEDSRPVSPYVNAGGKIVVNQVQPLRPHSMVEVYESNEITEKTSETERSNK